MMFIRPFVLCLVSLAACTSAASPIIDAPGPVVTSIVSDGALRVVLTDSPGRPGLLLVAPTVSGGPATIGAHAVRYGSLCTLAISAHAVVQGTHVTIRVTYASRPGASCPNEYRLLAYQADLGSLPAETYDVTLEHEEGSGGQVMLVVNQRVTVT